MQPLDHDRPGAVAPEKGAGGFRADKMKESKNLSNDYNNIRLTAWGSQFFFGLQIQALAHGGLDD
jgi:hypothetical protein